MCSSDIPAADPRIAESALKNSAIAEDALNWYKDYQTNVLAPLQQRTADVNERVTNQAMDIAQRNSDISNDAYQYQKSTFRPIEQAIASSASSYDTEANREKLAGQAQGDVQVAFDQAAAARTREMQRSGINPSSARTAAVMAQVDTARAGALAGAANKARTGAEAVGWARKVDAAGLGRNLSNQQATAAQIALSGGNSASNATGATAAGARADAGVMGQGFGTGIQGNTAAGNLFAQSSQQNISGATAGAGMQNELLGTVIGVGGRMLVPSDKNIKKDRKAIKPSAATQAIEAMPIDQWKYDETKTNAADGKTHVGPMAQDFAREVGGDGQTIDLGDSLGVTMAAVKDLSMRMKRLESPARMAARG